MSCVHDVTFARLKSFAIDSAKRRDEQQSLSLDHQHKQSLAGEERLGAAPPRIDRETRVACEIRTRLYKEWLSAEFDSSNVAGRSRSECYFAWTTTRRKSGDECRLTARSAFDCAEKAAF